jgi:hypothetical protein
MNWREILGAVLVGSGVGGMCVLIVLLTAAAMQSASPAHPMPIWIAHGCEGAGGDLWAMDLSDFPTNCKVYERY